MRPLVLAVVSNFCFATMASASTTSAPSFSEGLKEGSIEDVTFAANACVKAQTDTRSIAKSLNVAGWSSFKWAGRSWAGLTFFQQAGATKAIILVGRSSCEVAARVPVDTNQNDLLDSLDELGSREDQESRTWIVSNRLTFHLDFAGTSYRPVVRIHTITKKDQ